MKRKRGPLFVAGVELKPMFYYESLFGDKGPSGAALLLLSLSLHTTFAGGDLIKFQVRLGPDWPTAGA